MKVEFFIDRPIFSAVLSILIVVVGCIGLYLLPVDQYPQITPPMVKISASYPGASAQTVSQAVATPIEQELNGTPGMLYMESSSSNSGGLSINVTFDISANPELSAVEIQNRVKLAESRLPAEVVQNGISVEKQSSNQLMTLTLTSDDPRFDEIYLSNFATINVLDILRRIPGVGRVSNIGSRYYGMCIWVMPDRMANFGLTVKDLIVMGVFGALLMVCSMIGGVLFAVTPTLTFYFSIGAALLPGPVFLLLLAKVPKRWGLTIIGVIISLLSLIMGMHWGMCVGGLIGAFLADMIAGTKNYRSKKLNILAYIVYSFGPMGTYIAYFVDPEGWASTMLQNGTTQEYINAMNDAAAWWVLVIMIVGTALIAWLSGLVGCKLLRKQFEKAGITA